MIQDIYPHKLDNAYRNQKLTASDYILVFCKNQILIKGEEESMSLPLGADLENYDQNISEKCHYLFSIDEHAFFLAEEGFGDLLETKSGALHFTDLSVVRTWKVKWQAFATVTGAQLARWYKNHKYCGRCGLEMKESDKERALFCSECGNVVYPKLSPAIIVGITDGDRLLLTRYVNSRPNQYALVAGYVEVGETLEETVHREVLEEVGLHVKNITYYTSQPWGLSDSLLVGYFAEVDGSCEVTLQEDELCEGTWFLREEIPVEPHDFSMTNDMIQAFKNNRISRKQVI